MNVKPLALFALTHAWMQEMVSKVAPHDFEIKFVDNVICTPHVATGTVEAHLLKAQAQFDNFNRVLRGETPPNLVRI